MHLEVSPGALWGNLEASSKGQYLITFFPLLLAAHLRMNENTSLSIKMMVDHVNLHVFICLFNSKPWMDEMFDILSELRGFVMRKHKGKKTDPEEILYRKDAFGGGCVDWGRRYIWKHECEAIPLQKSDHRTGGI